ncbi:MAG TPA: GNAT family N-acetyltransferase [Candidatus Acidoferrales bacterium]|nr:GNAT family N-acetyltransferase [Candidatus Acidoferrales bacterium]
MADGREPAAPAETDAVLRDGSIIHPSRSSSGRPSGLVAFYESLSLQSLYFRFFGGIATFGHLVDRWLERGSLGLFALQNDRIVGHFGTVSPHRAEVGFAVADEMQGRGLGTILVGQLAATASATGTEEFEATILAENRPMLDVFRDSGFPIRILSGSGEIRIELPTSLTPQARRRFEDRDRLSAMSAMESFLRPQSVAVIGVSRRPGDREPRRNQAQGSRRPDQSRRRRAARPPCPLHC